ncbi:hypothetical protein MRX96_045930 [Rhipicephalus microplus]
MRGAFGPLRGTDFVAFAPRRKFFAGGFDVYCAAGSPVLASLKLLKDLDVASASAGSETASSSDELQERHGHRTLHIWNLDFDDISDVSLDANWNWTFVKLTGGTSRRRLDRYALWYSALWKDVLWSKSRFRKLFRAAEHADGVSDKDVQG